jgi:hypothetical protein
MKLKDGYFPEVVGGVAQSMISFSCRSGDGIDDACPVTDISAKRVFWTLLLHLRLLSGAFGGDSANGDRLYVRTPARLKL